MATAAAPSGYAAPVEASGDRYRYKYLIAISVTLAAVLELIDTSIVNGAIPHMMGNPGATLDETAGVAFATMLGFALDGSVFILPVFLQQLHGFTAWQTGR